MQPMYYIGLDVHKRKISYCVKDGSGRIHAEGSISATRLELDHWMRSLPQPWSAAMEATMFTGWIYATTLFDRMDSRRFWQNGAADAGGPFTKCLERSPSSELLYFRVRIRPHVRIERGAVALSRAAHAPFPPQVVHQLLFLTALSRSKAVDSEAMTVKN
jgi:hypothetical protein